MYLQEKVNKLRVLFSCSSVGITHRGIESFFVESFENLKSIADLDALLVKGAGEVKVNETVVKCLPKTSALAKILARMTGRSAYAVEQWTSFPAIVRRIRQFKPHVIFTSDANLVFLLNRFKRYIGGHFAILFSNGGPCYPPFDRFEYVHQVAPFYLDQALVAGESRSKHFLVPYGIQMSEFAVPSAIEKDCLRDQIGLPRGRPVILSVGWISRIHKRMDYLIEEVAKIEGPRPFLQLLGAMDENSEELVELGNRLLGAENFAVNSVPYSQVGNYYKASDIFVLASLQEGFGRVYLESLMHGLPTIGHRHPVMEYVLNDVGVLADLSISGNLTDVLTRQLSSLKTFDADQALERWKSVYSRFSWDVLRPEYNRMFRSVAAKAGCVGFEAAV